MVLVQEIQTKEERIEVVKTWLQPKFVKDIQVFIGFANFYECFIKSFGKITASLTSILRSTSTAPKLANKEIALGGNTENSSNGNIKYKNVSKTCFSKMNILIFETQIAFICLQKASIEALILHDFYLEHYIEIQTNASDDTIDAVFSQITLNQPLSSYRTVEDFSKSENSQLHSMVFIS